MSARTLEIIKRIYEAFENRDMPTFLNLLSPAINVIQCPEVPWGGSFDGFQGVEVFFGKVNLYLDSHVVIERILNGGDRVAVIGRACGTVKATGGHFDVPIMHLWAFHAGLAVRLEIVLDVPLMQAALSH
jgi:ketosteroid isomerase-like protein